MHQRTVQDALPTTVLILNLDLIAGHFDTLDDLAAKLPAQVRPVFADFKVRLAVVYTQKSEPLHLHGFSLSDRRLRHKPRARRPRRRAL